MRRILFLIFTGILAASGSGCGHHQAQPDVSSLPPPMPSLEPQAETRDEIVLRADGKDNFVRVEIVNGLDVTIPVQPERFALIVPGRTESTEELIKWKRGSMKHRMPVRELKPGESTVGILNFGERTDLVGRWLVYYPKPQADPVRTRIEPFHTSIFEESAPAARTP